MRPTFAEIRTAALAQNYKLLEANVRAHLLQSGAPFSPLATANSPVLIAVVKANAYGHGLALCGRALVEAGAGWLGVTSVEEGLALRAALGGKSPVRRSSAGGAGAEPGLSPRVLIMSGFFPGEEGAVLERHLTPQAWEGWHFSLLDAAARRAGMPPGTVPVHLEIDSGMSRQGVAPGDRLRALLAGAGFEADSPLFIEGVMTHFSSPETPGNGVMAAQVERFAAALQQLGEAGIRPRWIHAGNSVNASSGIEIAQLARLAARNGSEMLVRPGLALYGIGGESFARIPPRGDSGNASVKDAGNIGERLEPVLTWRTEVTSLREVPAGTAVGYNETYRTAAPVPVNAELDSAAGADSRAKLNSAPDMGAAGSMTRLALLPVGYADGFNRLLSNRGWVLVRGQRAPVVGRVSMDQTVVDVTGIPGVEVGEPVVLLGSQAPSGTGVVTLFNLSAEEIAALCGTIPYETVCAISARVKRVAV